MNIIITMAGLGTRFRKAGYKCPKYMIEARGKTLFEWSMESLLGYNNIATKYVFVVRKEDNSEAFIKESMKKFGDFDTRVVCIDYLTDGQATTAMLAMPYCNDNEPIMIYNIDTYVEAGLMDYIDIRGDGYIPCFCAEGDHWSFVKLDENGNAIEVREKERISNNCTIGAYYFSSANLYKELYREYYGKNNKIKQNEKYIAPLYNLMIHKGMKVYITILDEKRVHVLGTPEELQIFLND